MHLSLAEVAPAAPLVIEALPPLLILAGLLVALGIIVVLDGLVRGLLNGLASLTSNIPFVGSITASAFHNVEHAISNGLGNAISGIESRIAHQFHNLARVLEHFWHQFVRMAENAYDIARLVAGAATYPDIGRLNRDLRKLVKRAEHAAAAAVAKALHDAKGYTHSVAQGVYPRLRHLEHEVTKTLPREIRHARSLAREAEDGVARLWGRVKALERSVGAGAIAAVVATVLAAVGLDWLGCRDGASRVGRSGCGLWDDLGDVLGLLAAVELALNFETFVHDAQVAAEGTVTAVKDVAGLG